MVRIKGFMQKKISGFTLIELIIGVSLIAILAAMAVTAFQNITEKAQIANLRATLKRVKSAILIQKANNELSENYFDAGNCHPRKDFWPTYEEVRKTSYEAQLQGSILNTVMPSNPFITNPRTPPFDNSFAADCSGAIIHNNFNLGTSNANNLVVAAPEGVARGTLCPAAPCDAAWAYSPYTGEFWATSNRFGENEW